MGGVADDRGDMEEDKDDQEDKEDADEEEEILGDKSTEENSPSPGGGKGASGRMNRGWAAKEDGRARGRPPLTKKKKEKK